MMLTPQVSNVCDFYTWKSVQSIASNDPAANANMAVDQFQVQADRFFVFMAWRGVTNYDALAGEFESANVARALYNPAVVPSYFEVMVKRDDDYNMMTYPMPQGALASYGYAAGAQVPWPIIYAPLTRFYFEFYNVSPFVMTEHDQSTVIPLRIDFGLYGYSVASENLSTFLKSWPSLWQVFQASRNLTDALTCLSSQDFSNIVPGV